MSKSRSDFKFDFTKLATQLDTERERVRRYVLRWVQQLNGGDAAIKWHGITVGDIVAEFEARFRELNDETVHKMVEEAHKL